jgi:hypothetical protein
MRDLRRASWFAAVFAAAFVLAPAVSGQQAQGTGAQNGQTQTSEPIPAYHSPYEPNSEDEGSQNVQPDTRPLSGAQYLSLGNLTTSRSYWQPQFDITGTADSNPTESTSNTSWGGWGTFLGGVDIHHNSGVSQLTLSYLGGGAYSDEPYVQNGAIQELGLTEQVSFRRAVLTFLEMTEYLPNALAGLGGVGGLPQIGAGSGSIGLGAGFLNGQTILSGEGESLDNTSIVELNTFLTPRSSITLEGGYSLLHFFGSDLIDSGDVIFHGGYNYQLSQHNTMALFYAFNQFSFGNSSQLTGSSSPLIGNQSIDTHSVEASFGRRVTGRLAFQVAGGPEISVFSNGTGAATAGTTGASTGSSVNLNWTLDSAVTYQYQRTTVAASYAHGVYAGSGVFLGSVSDIVTGTLSRRMSKTFSSGLSAGYSRNTALSGTGAPNLGQNYSYWFAEASLARPLNEALAFTFSYQLQYQNSNSTFCIGASCGMSVVRNLISVGLSWRQHPMLF